MGERAGVVACLMPPTRGIGNERGQESHQRPPFFHGAAEVMHGRLIGALGVGNRRARVGQDSGRDGAQSRPDRRFGSQGVFFGHKRFYGAVHVVSMGCFMTL
jgi:hypothetical protein